jgi:hypothetical protein
MKFLKFNKSKKSKEGIEFFFWISKVVYQKTQKGVPNTIGIGRQAHKQPPKIKPYKQKPNQGNNPIKPKKNQPKKKHPKTTPTPLLHHKGEGISNFRPKKAPPTLALHLRGEDPLDEIGDAALGPKKPLRIKLGAFSGAQIALARITSDTDNLTVSVAPDPEVELQTNLASEIVP